VNQGTFGNSGRRIKNTFVTAMTLRVDVRKILLVVLLIVAAVFGLAYVFPKRDITQLVPVHLNITVQDRAQHMPVQDAAVILKYPATDLTGRASMDPSLFNKVIVTEHTDLDGRAIVTHQFGAQVRTSLWGKKGDVVFEQNLVVEAAGFLPFEAPLATLIGQPRSFKDRSDVRLKIQLYPVAQGASR
jgi:hypothetical protein